MWSGLMDWLKSNEELPIEHSIIKSPVIYTGKERVPPRPSVEIISSRFFIIRISDLSLQLKQNNIFWTGAIFFVSIKANTLLDVLTVISWCEWYSLQGCIKVVAWGLWHESNLYINIKRSREAADRLWISNVLLMQKLFLIKQRISLSRRHLCKVRIYHSIYVYLGMRKILIWSFTAKLSFEIWFRVTPHDPSWIRIPRETWKTGKT